MIATASTIRRKGLYATGSVFSVYVLISAVLSFVSPFVTVTANSALSFAPTFDATAANHAALYYGSLSLLASLATIGRGRMIADLAIARQKARVTLNSKNIYRIAVLLLFIIVVISFVHFIFVDKELLVHAPAYLFLSDPKKLGLSGEILPFLHRGLAIFGLISVCLSLYLFYARAYATFFISVLPSFYITLLRLSASSRFVVVYFFAIFLAFTIFSSARGTKRWLIQGILIFLILCVYLIAMKGRADPNQGLSHLYDHITNVDIGYDFIGVMLANVFQGGLIFAQALNMNITYPSKYIELSFSPFPSFIDGFSSAAAQYAVGINMWTPLNAFSEAYHMGPLATVLLWISIFIWIRSATKAQLANPGIPSLSILVASALVTVLLNQYAIRTSYRILLIITVVSIASIYWKKYLRPNGNIALSARRHNPVGSNAASRRLAPRRLSNKRG